MVEWGVERGKDDDFVASIYPQPPWSPKKNIRKKYQESGLPNLRILS